MAHFNFVISQNAKWGHAGFYIDCHRMTVLENILLQKKHCLFPTTELCSNKCSDQLTNMQPISVWLTLTLVAVTGC